jgi:hypothetical protein
MSVFNWLTELIYEYRLEIKNGFQVFIHFFYDLDMIGFGGSPSSCTLAHTQNLTPQKSPGVDLDFEVLINYSVKNSHSEI